MNNPKVNVVVSGHKNDYHSTYKTYILRGGVDFASQVIMPNTKYVVKHDFDLGGGAFDIDFTNADTHTVAEVTYYYIPFTANGSKYMLIDDTLVFIDAEWNGLSAREIKPAKGTLFMIASITGGLHKNGYGINVVNVPENCILEFDGGSLKNGTIIGQDTLFINVGDVEIWGKNLIREGTWLEKQCSGCDYLRDKNYDPETHSGLGRKILRLKLDGSNILTQEDFDQSNTVYVVSYDFSLNGQRVQIPANSIIEYNGGSIRNGCLMSDKTKVVGMFSEDDCLWGVYYNGNGDCLSYKYTIPQKVSSCINHIVSTSIVENITSPQSIIVSGDNIIVFSVNNDSNENIKAWAHLFDKNYNYRGKCVFDVYMHCNGACVKGNDVFIAGWDTNKLHKASLSSIIAACESPQVVEVSTSVVFEREGRINSVCYDPEFNQFAVLENYYVTIYDGSFNLIKRSSISLLDLYEEESLNQQAVFKKGQYIQMGVNMAEWTASAHGSSLIIVYDCATDNIVTYNTFMPALANTEMEGLYFDPDNDDELYIVGEKGTGVGGGTVMIGKVSYLKDVIGVSTKLESSEGLANVCGSQRLYVDNTYTGFSNGDRQHPFKDIKSALNSFGQSGYIFLYVIATNTEYNVGNIEFHGASYIYIRGLENNGINRPDIRGNFSVSHNAALNLNNLNLISDTEYTLSIVYCSNITVQYCDFYKINKNNTVKDGTHVGLNTVVNSTFEYVNFHAAYDAVYTHNRQEYSNVQFNNCFAENLYTVIRTNGHLKCGNVAVGDINSWINVANTCDNIITRVETNISAAYDSIIFSVNSNSEVDTFMNTIANKLANGTSSLFIFETTVANPNIEGLVFRPGLYYIYNSVPVSYGKGYSMIRGNENGNWNQITSDLLGKYSVKSDEPIIGKDQDNKLIWAHTNYESGVRSVLRYDGYPLSIKTHGATEQRPAANSVSVGFRFFDETLGKPIYSNGTVWVDANGVNPDTGTWETISTFDMSSITPWHYNTSLGNYWAYSIDNPSIIPGDTYRIVKVSGETPLAFRYDFDGTDRDISKTVNQEIVVPSFSTVTIHMLFDYAEAQPSSGVYRLEKKS